MNSLEWTEESTELTASVIKQRSICDMKKKQKMFYVLSELTVNTYCYIFAHTDAIPATIGT